MDYLAVAHSFGLLHRRSQAVVWEKCQEIGLSYSGYGLLLTLFEHEGSSQEELAARLFMDKTVVTERSRLSRPEASLRAAGMWRTAGVSVCT